jgi:hypothetical protein
MERELLAVCRNFFALARVRARPFYCLTQCLEANGDVMHPWYERWRKVPNIRRVRILPDRRAQQKEERRSTAVPVSSNVENVLESSLVDELHLTEADGHVGKLVMPLRDTIERIVSK